MSMASSDTSGYPYRLINAGEIENRGIEIALNTRPVQVGDFSWDLNLNFSITFPSPRILLVQATFLSGDVLIECRKHQESVIHVSGLCIQMYR